MAALLVGGDSPYEGHHVRSRMPPALQVSEHAAESLGGRNVPQLMGALSGQGSYPLQRIHAFRFHGLSDCSFRDGALDTTSQQFGEQPGRPQPAFLAYAREVARELEVVEQTGALQPAYRLRNRAWPMSLGVQPASQLVAGTGPGRKRSGCRRVGLFGLNRRLQPCPPVSVELHSLLQSESTDPLDW